MSAIYPVSEYVADTALINDAQYQEMYEWSVRDPGEFWSAQARERLTWFKEWDSTLEWDYHKAHIRWFQGGKLNVSYNCVDRHLESRADKRAIVWEGNEPGDTRTLTYRDLHREVCKFANVLSAEGVQQGDRVAIYMPMVPELAIAMLACARVGAVHSVIFAGFSADSVRDRVNDCEAKLVITANEGVRGTKTIGLKDIVDRALDGVTCVESVIVYKRTDAEVPMLSGRDQWWHDLMTNALEVCDAAELDAEDPLFILYTSGSTGKPKGVLHTQAGYLLYASTTHQYVFDYHEDDIYFCAADIGWVTGHSYIVYGPLANGATTLMFESIPTYPDAGRYWDVVSRHKVNIFYTAPTAIRAIAKEGDDFVNRYDLNSLRVLGTVGEPINKDAWEW